MALEGRLSACEMRAFAARHAATLDADNHAAFVEAFLVQLGARLSCYVCMCVCLSRPRPPTCRQVGEGGARLTRRTGAHETVSAL